MSYVKNLTFHQTVLKNSYIALERYWQGKWKKKSQKVNKPFCLLTQKHTVDQSQRMIFSKSRNLQHRNLLRDKFRGKMVLNTALFNLQRNNVARQVVRKCCPYYLTLMTDWSSYAQRILGSPWGKHRFSVKSGVFGHRITHFCHDFVRSGSD